MMLLRFSLYGLSFLTAVYVLLRFYPSFVKKFVQFFTKESFSGPGEAQRACFLPLSSSLQPKPRRLFSLGVFAFSPFNKVFSLWQFVSLDQKLNKICREESARILSFTDLKVFELSKASEALLKVELFNSLVCFTFFDGTVLRFHTFSRGTVAALKAEVNNSPPGAVSLVASSSESGIHQLTFRTDATYILITSSYLTASYTGV